MKRYIIWLVIFAALEISLALYLTYFREHFWDSIQAKQFGQFVNQLVVFMVAALSICVVSGISGYLVSLTGIEWRKKLNDKAFSVREQDNIENMPQRIQSDCTEYPDLVLTLGFGLIKAVFYILVFSISLMLSFSWYYLLVLVVYSIVGTIITHFVAKPLIRLNYDNQRAEATYRNDLSISNFEDCIRIMLGLARKQKHLTYWQQFYGQLGVIVPLILIAPVYFTSSLFTLGLLMRFNSLASTILDNLSYGITSFSQINRLISCRNRLKEASIIK